MPTAVEQPEGNGKMSLAGLLPPVYVILGGVGLFAGLAYYLGWQYTKEYYEEFGLPFSALSFSPQDYMVASRTTVIVALGPFAAMLLGISLARLFPTFFYTLFGPSQRDSQSLGRRASLVLDFLDKSADYIQVHGFQLVLILMAIIDFFWLETGLWMTYAVFALTLFLFRQWILRSKEGRQVTIAIGLIALYALIIVVFWFPGQLGSTDAQKVLDDPSKLPLATITFTEDAAAELEGQLPEDGGPFRILLRNNGVYWILDEDNVGTVFAVPEESIAVVTYRKD